MPIAQILIFGFALTNEVKNANIVVVDYAKDESSQKLLTKIEASQYFEIEKVVLSADQIEKAFQEGVIKLALVIPSNFDSDLAHQNHAQIQVIADASDPNTANTLTNYISAIVQGLSAGAHE